MKKPRKTRRSLQDEVRLLDKQMNDRFAIAELEVRCLKVERAYAELSAKLVALLSPEQIDAAKTCGVTPAVYALEWIQIYKEGLRKTAPAFSHVVDLESVRRTA